MRVRVRLAFAALAGAMLVSSCATLNVDSMPTPGSIRNGYDIVIEFDNVLNLPARAKVVMDGTKVGEVTNVTLTSRGVDVTTRIDPDVTVPSNIHSLLQQATVLGDTYIAFERPPGADSALPLRPGGRIGLAQTSSPPQLEDTLASFANFIGSGSIQRAQNTVIRINKITPPQPQIRQMSARVATDLADLSNNVATLDQWVQGLSGTGTVLGRNAPVLDRWLSPSGVMGWHHFFIITHYIAPVLPTIGTIFYNGYWLVPTLDKAAGALEAFQHSKWAFDEEVPHWQKLFTDFLLPARQYPAMNITSIKGPDGRELSGNTQEVLRMIGAMP